MIRRPRSPTLFPYTPLFRSQDLIRNDGPRLTAGVVDHAAPELTEPRGHGLVIAHPGSHGEGVADQNRADLRDFDRRLLRRGIRSEEHTSELQSQSHIVCRLL